MKEPQQEGIVGKINDILAMRITMLVGSIWAFYAFVIFGLTPILWPQYETQILYWSNFLQLVFLPVITVGTAIMNRDTERRAKEDHHTIKQEFGLLREADTMLHTTLQEIAAGVRELLLRSKHEGSEAPRALAREMATPHRKASKR
ncbi:MAG TPA: hypothetical protein VLB11_07035 [Methyloceanibacter sp.]|nr:hypothetical protein [Methyloceanibacter sp.]